MIRIPTVLVLGAGASNPYGFPTGKEMVQDVLKELSAPLIGSWGRELSDSFGIDQDHIELFRKSLQLSGQPSVDAFLERRPEFLAVGKLNMAHAIIKKEHHKPLLHQVIENADWYRYVFLKMDSPRFEDFAKNELAIITFNYDRSLEEFLFQRLKHSHGISDSDCAAQLSKIAIVHVHGSLGSLSWQTSDGKSYSPSYSADELKKASGQILVLSEAQKTSNEFQRASYLMSKANKIIFLGFGFHTQNLNRLRIKDFRSISMTGSSLGMKRGEAQGISGEWNIVLPNEHLNCLEFLRESGSLR